jgi:hypothetical protein
LAHHYSSSSDTARMWKDCDLGQNSMITIP